jgi:hypothetical protein
MGKIPCAVTDDVWHNPPDGCHDFIAWPFMPTSDPNDARELVRYMFDHQPEIISIDPRFARGVTTVTLFVRGWIGRDPSFTAYRSDWRHHDLVAITAACIAALRWKLSDLDGLTGRVEPTVESLRAAQEGEKKT